MVLLICNFIDRYILCFLNYISLQLQHYFTITFIQDSKYVISNICKLNHKIRKGHEFFIFMLNL